MSGPDVNDLQVTNAIPPREINSEEWRSFFLGYSQSETVDRPVPMQAFG